MEELAGLIYLQGLLRFSYTMSQTLVITGLQLWPLPSCVTSEAQIILGPTSKFEPHHCSRTPRSILRRWWPAGLVWGWGRYQKLFPDYTSLSKFLSSNALSPGDLLGLPQKKALFYWFLDFWESVFPACENSHSQLSCWHCSKAAHKPLPQKCRVLRWLSPTSSSPEHSRKCTALGQQQALLLRASAPAQSPHS